MIARYRGTCQGTGDWIKPGDEIVKDERGWMHRRCQPRTRENQEYAQGIADGRRYQQEKKMYGERLAEQFAIEDEMNRYWKYGED